MGSGFRTFTAGEVLTASNVQNYLMDQSVMVFGGSAARSSAIGTANFEEGMVSYLTDTDKVEAYNGTDWVSVAPTSSQGLTLINTTSFSGVSSVSAPADTFTSTYANYKVLIYLTSSSGSNTLRFRIRAAGTDLTTGTYRTLAYYANSAANSFNGLESSSSGTYGALSYSGIQGNAVEFDIFNPKIADYTHLRSTSTFADSTNMFLLSSGVVVNNTTSYDSFTIFPAANNITGTIRVFGYNN